MAHEEITNLQFGHNQFVIGWHFRNAVVTDGAHGVIEQNIIDPKTGHGSFVGGFNAATRLTKYIFHARAQLAVGVTHWDVVEVPANDFWEIAGNHVLFDQINLLCPVLVSQSQASDDAFAAFNVYGLLLGLFLHHGIILFGKPE